MLNGKLRYIPEHATWEYKFLDDYFYLNREATKWHVYFSDYHQKPTDLDMRCLYTLDTIYTSFPSRKEAIKYIDTLHFFGALERYMIHELPKEWLEENRFDIAAELLWTRDGVPLIWRDVFKVLSNFKQGRDLDYYIGWHIVDDVPDQYGPKARSVESGEIYTNAPLSSLAVVKNRAGL